MTFDHLQLGHKNAMHWGQLPGACVSPAPRIYCWKVHSPSKIDLPFASCQTESAKVLRTNKKNIQVHWLYSILLNSVCFTYKNFMTSSAWFPPTSSRTHLAKPQEATALKMAHTEARLQRSEQLRQQLHGSFANVLGRLENSERKESQLHQVRAAGRLGVGKWEIRCQTWQACRNL